MSVRRRLGLAFVVVMALFLVPVLYAQLRLNDLREMAVERRSQHATATLALGAFRAGIADFDWQQRAYLATLDTRMEGEVEEAARALGLHVARLEHAGYRSATRGLAAQVDSLLTLSREIDRLIRAEEVDAATRTFRRVARLRDRMADELEGIAAAIDQASREDFTRAGEMSATAATTTIIATLAAAVLGLLVSLWTTGALTTPLRRLTGAAARVEAGAFEAPDDLPYDRGDEIGNLSRSFRAMTDRLAVLDQLKAEFLSVASHELKTPISVIRAYAELIDYQLRDQMTDQQQAALDAIVEQTDVMVRLLGRLLDIGRLEAGVYRLEPEPVEIATLLDELARSFDPLVDKQEVRLVMEIDETAPATIHVDADLLRNEVLGNLVSNALRYTPAGGEIRVAVWREEKTVILEVSDTGPGVPEAQRPYIFEKYYEGDRTRVMGAGLGLAVAKEVTEAHGGRITLEPTEGRGATFRVCLPASPEP